MPQWTSIINFFSTIQSKTASSLSFALKSVELTIYERQIRKLVVSWAPQNYRLGDSPLAYRMRSTDFIAKERLLAVYTARVVIRSRDLGTGTHYTVNTVPSFAVKVLKTASQRNLKGTRLFRILTIPSYFFN